MVDHVDRALTSKFGREELQDAEYQCGLALPYHPRRGRAAGVGSR